MNEFRVRTGGLESIAGVLAGRRAAGSKVLAVGGEDGTDWRAGC